MSETGGARLQEFGPELWIADGPSVSFLGFPYPTRMAVARLRDGGLWVWSPIALDPDLRKEVEALGPVRHLVEPNKIHHLALAEWTAAFPEARLHAPPGLAAKRTDLHFDAELGDEPDPTWADEIDQVIFRGSFALEEVVFFHRPSRTAVVCDLVQRFEKEQLPPVRRLVMTLWGLVGERGSTPREWRASFWKRSLAREARRRALAWDPERLVIAHGTCARENGRQVLETGLRWLG